MKVWLKSALDENNDKVVMLELPTTEGALLRCMDELNLPEVSTEKNCIAVKVENLKYLNNQRVNIDELQYLAKRLDGIADMNTFYAAEHKEKYKEVKDLINLTFDVDNMKYFLILDFTNKLKLSQEYVMAKKMSMPTVEYEKITEDAIDELLEGYKPIDVSEYGLLYEIKDGSQLLYDGYTFPAYLYDACVLAVEITQKSSQVPENENKATEFLYFPCEDVCIDKAINRMTVKGAAPFDIDIKGFRPGGSRIEDEIKRMVGNELDKEKLYLLNNVCQKIYDVDIEDLSNSKFRAILEFCHPQDINELETVLQNYNDFYFIISIDDSKGYGEYLLYESGKYEVPIELEDYIDSSAFGDDVLEGMLYKFTDEGFVRYDGDCDDIFEMIKRIQEETQDISKLCDENSIEMR